MCFNWEPIHSGKARRVTKNSLRDRGPRAPLTADYGGAIIYGIFHRIFSHCWYLNPFVSNLEIELIRLCSLSKSKKEWLTMLFVIWLWAGEMKLTPWGLRGPPPSARPQRDKKVKIRYRLAQEWHRKLKSAKATVCVQPGSNNEQSREAKKSRIPNKSQKLHFPTMLLVVVVGFLPAGRR